jgi:hypothetical protein
MNVEEKLVAIKKAAEKIRQIDISRNLEKMEVYKCIEKELKLDVTSERYLWEYVMLGFQSYEYSIEKIFEKNVDDDC